MQKISRSAYGFTLIELFTVMAVVAILFGIAYPVFISIMERARKTQAKNDLTQIATAVNAYYTDYGRYPVDLAAGNTTDAYYGSGTVPPGATSHGTNDWLFDAIRDNTFSTKASANTCPGTNLVTCLNARGIVFIQPPDSKVSNPARAGVDSVTTSPTFGAWFDPWGSPYNIAIDATYNNQITNPYTADTGAGPGTLRQGVIGWSLGKDGAGGSGNKNSGTSADDILSWQ
jgi:prepilin-type N-terminal cleavage/methylation domain-containing protein